MDLLKLKREVYKINKQASSLCGRRVLIPLSIINESYKDAVVYGKITDLDLSENYVEIVFNDPEDNEEIVEHFSIREFVNSIELR